MQCAEVGLSWLLTDPRLPPGAVRMQRAVLPSKVLSNLEEVGSELLPDNQIIAPSARAQEDPRLALSGSQASH